MLVYRTPKRSVNTAAVLDRAKLDLGAFLIEFGEIESALLDLGWEEPERLRRVMLSAARREQPDLSGLDLPRTVEISVPEGYAYYGLFPEMYASAARRFFSDHGPESVAVIGIRSIGTSLSAVVAATLEKLGARVDSFSVRPEGHPFDRRVELTPAQRAIAGAPHDWCVVVDEGPGLSGSSFAAAAACLPAPIALFPSWIPDGSEFVNVAARETWRRYPKYSVSFEEVFPDPGRIDLSAGKWRAIVYASESQYPPVQPRQEARKFLRVSESGTVLQKFAGLARYGEEKLAVARRLAAAGFCPPVLGLENGFLLSEFVPGTPLSRREWNSDLCETIARYLAFRYRELPAGSATEPAELAEMVRVNSGKAVGLPPRGRAVAIDGRMLPHEWLATRDGYRKTDSLDHHDNHFYPGNTDIAWDIAGTIEEFGLEETRRHALIERYRLHSGDADIESRLPFYREAYAAFNAGYAQLVRT